MSVRFRAIVSDLRISAGVYGAMQASLVLQITGPIPENLPELVSARDVEWRAEVDAPAQASSFRSRQALAARDEADDEFDDAIAASGIGMAQIQDLIARYRERHEATLVLRLIGPVPPKS